MSVCARVCICFCCQLNKNCHQKRCKHFILLKLYSEENDVHLVKKNLDLHNYEKNHGASSSYAML